MQFLPQCLIIWAKELKTFYWSQHQYSTYQFDSELIPSLIQFSAWKCQFQCQLLSGLKPGRWTVVLSVVTPSCWVCSASIQSACLAGFHSLCCCLSFWPLCSSLLSDRSHLSTDNISFIWSEAPKGSQVKLDSGSPQARGIKDWQERVHTFCSWDL